MPLVKRNKSSAKKTLPTPREDYKMGNMDWAVRNPSSLGRDCKMQLVGWEESLAMKISPIPREGCEIGNVDLAKRNPLS